MGWNGCRNSDQCGKDFTKSHPGPASMETHWNPSLRMGILSSASQKGSRKELGALGQHRAPWGGKSWQLREGLEHSSDLGVVINQELKSAINSLSDNVE